MKSLLLATALALTLAACSPPTPAAAPKQEEMADMAAPAAVAGPVRSTGVITAIDADAGTITLNHEAIEAIGWSAMTMRFNAADPALLNGLAVGDHVSFELKSADEPGTLIAVQKQ